jgi:hypothetical protein
MWVGDVLKRPHLYLVYESMRGHNHNNHEHDHNHDHNPGLSDS